MRTEIIEIGSIHELKDRSAELYKKALENERRHIQDNGCVWQEEILDSAKAILAELGMELHGDFTNDAVGRTAAQLEDHLPGKDPKKRQKFLARMVGFVDSKLFPLVYHRGRKIRNIVNEAELDRAGNRRRLRRRADHRVV